jgi:hypothetical protein
MDYLRLVLRQMAGTPPHIAQVVRLGVGLEDLSPYFDASSVSAKAKKKKKPK